MPAHVRLDFSVSAAETLHNSFCPRIQPQQQFLHTLREALGNFAPTKDVSNTLAFVNRPQEGKPVLKQDLQILHIFRRQLLFTYDAPQLIKQIGTLIKTIFHRVHVIRFNRICFIKTANSLQRQLAKANQSVAGSAI